MSQAQSNDDLSLPDGYRWITWEIGTAELQKSVMTLETFAALKAGETNVERIRNAIRLRRKLCVKQSTGKWTETASDRFVNEHAWVLAVMNEHAMCLKVNSRTRITSLLPGAEASLADVIQFFKRNEPFNWEPTPYKKAPGW